MAALRKHFKKTYLEVPGWCSVYQSFYRVYVLHAVLLHAVLLHTRPVPR